LIKDTVAWIIGEDFLLGPTLVTTTGANMATGSAASTDRGRPAPPLSLWWAPLDLPASSAARLTACLSSEERTRADDYAHPIDRDHFAVARGWLRHLLADQLQCRPNEIRISARPGGKPAIESSDLKFNGSRSGGIAFYATSWTTEVGVDIEAIRSDAARDIEDMATTFFSADERRTLAAMAPGPRLAATFQCWTCKEAYGKGIGSGLLFPLSTVDTWAGTGRPATVSGWTVHQIAVSPGFVAAVAGEGLDGWVPPAPQPISSPDPDPPARYH
jgi:4'-phosphopantetheinyl transferase